MDKQAIAAEGRKVVRGGGVVGAVGGVGAVGAVGAVGGGVGVEARGRRPAAAAAGMRAMNAMRSHSPSRGTRREHHIPPFDCGHGYSPSDERDLKVEREIAFENGFFVGMGVCSLIATVLIVAFYVASRFAS